MQDSTAGKMTKILGIEFAPLNIPLERRLQTFAVLQWTVAFLFEGFGCLGLTIFLLFTRFYWISLLYGVWLYFDRHTHRRGGRRWQWCRNWQLWKYFAQYFPIKLIKTVELEHSKNYIFGYHPHGIMAHGAFCTFGTEGNGFSKIFPGFQPFLAVLDGQFWFPFHRDYLMTSGCISCTKDSLHWALTKEGIGNIVVLIVGGAPEALEAKPGCYNVKLSNRMGFVKQALLHGASLVPVYSFGENSVFDQADNPEGSRLRAFQDKLVNYMGFSMPVFKGRGVFNYSFGIMPRRHPINVVVGEPIDVEQTDNPTSEEIETLHKKYVTSLKELFEKHKQQYGAHEEDHLHIV